MNQNIVAVTKQVTYQDLNRDANQGGNAERACGRVWLYSVRLMGNEVQSSYTAKEKLVKGYYKCLVYVEK